MFFHSHRGIVVVVSVCVCVCVYVCACFMLQIRRCETADGYGLKKKAPSSNQQLQVANDVGVANYFIAKPPN